MKVVPAFVVALNLASSAVGPFAQSRLENSDYVQAAIIEGRLRQVEPYVLRHAINDSDTVGLVYTPYVRVARFVWKRKEAGREVEAKDIPSDVGAPVMHVAMQQPGRQHPGEYTSLKIAQIKRPPGAPPPGQSYSFFPDPRRLAEPLRVLNPKTESALFGDFPLARIAIIGVFSMAVAQGHTLEFCTYREYIGEDNTRRYDVLAGFSPGPLR